MSIGTNGERRSSAARTGRMTMSVGAALLGLAGAAAAQTAPLSIVTSEDPGQPGAFTLNFGDLGFLASSSISSTTYELSIDPIGGTARFESYLQYVQPLVLPGGFSTGDITVEIVPGSSTGAFDPLTSTFSTSEVYAVHFTGDLSAFGLTSPVFLPSTSTGEVALSSLGGEVVMDWDGEGLLFNPGDPSTPLQFTYRCAVNTVFQAEPESMVGLSLVPDVARLELPSRIGLELLRTLDLALVRIQEGSTAKARSALRTFIKQVELLRGLLIDDAEAEALVTTARETLDLMGFGATVPTGGSR